MFSYVMAKIKNICAVFNAVRFNRPVILKGLPLIVAYRVLKIELKQKQIAAYSMSKVM